MHSKSQNIIAALREPKFAIFVAGQVISQFGDYLAQIALIEVVGVVTKRAPLAYSQLTVAIALPALLFGPIVGALVDRRPKRRVLMTVDLCRAAVIAMIPLLIRPGHAGRSLVLLFPLVFANFLLGLFSSSARLALIPSLVPPAKIFSANAVMNFINKLAGLVGFVGGSLLVVGMFWRHLHLRPWQAGFYLDSLSFLASVAALSLIRIDEPMPQRPRGESFRELWGRRIANLKGDLRELGSLLTANPRVKFVAFTLLLVALFGGTLYPLVVVIVQKGLRIGAGAGTRGVGLLGGVLALGMMAGTLIVGFLAHRLPRQRLIVAGLCGVGLALAVFALSRHYWELLAVAFAAGVFLAPVLVAQDTLLHESAPENLWGRVFSGRDIILNGGFMASSVALGFVAQIVLPRLGTANHERVTLFWAGLALSAMSLAGLRLWPGRGAVAEFRLRRNRNP